MRITLNLTAATLPALPALSVALTEILCLLPLPLADFALALKGEAQRLKRALSSLHSKAAPASDLKDTLTLAVFFLVLTLPIGFLRIVVPGALVSTAKALVAGVESELDEASTARIWT